MPREYQIKPGTASPSPMQFGSADINLQTPRFVAQTNVAPKENPFEALQKILGLTAEIVGKYTDAQARGIEQKINYQLAIQKKQDREEAILDRAQVEKRRAESEAAAAWEAEARYELASAKTAAEATAIAEKSLQKAGEESSAMTASRAQVVMAARATARQLQSEAEGDPKEREAAIKYEAAARLEIAKATSVEALKKIRDNALDDSAHANTPIMSTSRAQVSAAAEARINQLEGKADQLGLDSRKATLAWESMRIQNAFEAGNDKELGGLAKTYADKSLSSTTPEERSIFNTLREQAFAKQQQIGNNIEQANLKEERAAAIRAATLTSQLAEPIINGFAADMVSTFKDFNAVSDESLAAALFDSVRDRMVKDNPQLAEMWNASDSEIEHAAVSEAITKAIDPVLKSIIAQRNRENVIKSQELTINSYAQQAKEAGFDSTYAKATSVDVLDPTIQRRAVREITKAAIDSKETDLDKINEASRIISTYGDPDSNIEAVRMRRDAIDRINKTIDLEHQSILTEADTAGPTFPVDDVAVGWRTRFPDKDSFFKWILESKLGVDIATFQNSPEMQSMFGPMLTKYGTQFDVDSSKTDSNKKSQDLEFKRSEATLKKTMTGEQGWPASPLRAYMNGETGVPYGSLDVATTEDLVRDALIGYTDNSVPSELMEAVKKNVGDERNYPLIQAFWRVQQRNPNATIRYAIVSDPAMFDSWALAQYLEYSSGKELTQATVNARAKDFMGNIQAYKEPTSKTEKFNANRALRTQVITELAGGAGIDTGVLKFSGVDPDAAIKNMGPSDRDFLIALSAVASALPGESKSFLSSMMKENGFRFYPVTNDDGSSFHMMLNPSQIRPDITTRGLPEPDELESSAWMAYLESKKKQAAEALNKRPALGGIAYTYTEKDISSLYIYPTTYDIQYGQCAVKVKIGKNIKSLDCRELKVTEQDYLLFKKEYTQPKIDTTYNLGTALLVP